HDEIADVIGQKALRPVYEVRELDPPATRNAEAAGSGETLASLRIPLPWGQFPAGTGIARRPARGQLAAPRNLQLQRRGETRRHCFTLLQLREVAVVVLSAL